MGAGARPGFGRGVVCGLRGLAQCVTTPALWPWSLVPAALTALAFGAFWWNHGAIVQAAYSATIDEHNAAPWWFRALATLALVVFTYFLFAPVARVLSAPFLALLSDRTAERLAGVPLPPPPGPPFVRWVARPILDALVFLAVRAAAFLLILPIACIPGAGFVVLALVTCPLEGLDRMDVAMSSRAVPLRERLRFVRTHFAACLGLGAVATLLLFVPIANVLLLPGLTVGAVMLDREATAAAGPPQERAA